MRRERKSRSFIGLYFVVAMLLAVVLVGGCFPTDVKAADNEITLSVKSGDDITNALQSAVKSYDKVIIPEGEYYCSGVKLNNLEGITISAEGATIVQSGSANPIFYVSNGSTASDITIDGGTWDANDQNLPAFRFYGTVENVTLQNLTVSNSTNAGVRFKESSNVIVNNVTVTDNQGYALLFEATTGVQVDNSVLKNSQCGIKFDSCKGQAIVTNSECTGNGERAILVVGNENITINDCELNKNAEGLRISGVTGKVSLSRNNIKNNEGFGIRIFDCTGDVAYSKNYAYDNGSTGISMENCTGINSLYRVNAKRNGDCGFNLTKCTNIKINNCVSSNNKNYGIILDSNTADSRYKYCVNLKSSTISSNGKSGIRCVNGAQTNIQETEVSGNVEAGIYAENCEAVTLNKVVSKNNQSNGASINSTTNVKAANCTIDNNTENGLRIYECLNIWVTNGEFSNNGKTGLGLATVDKISIKGAVMHDNKGYGLNIDGLTTSGLVKDAQSYKNGDIGLRYKDTEGKINTQYSKVYENAGSGIYGVNCANMVVNGTEVYNNAGFGINATDSPLANVKYCDVHDNEDIGIRYSGCPKIIVTDSDSYNNVNAGIYATDCTTITFNMAEVKNNDGFGINVNNGTAVSTINSVAEGNKEAGLRYNTCKRVKIENTTSDSNSGAGLYASTVSGYIKLTGVSINANGEYGINLNSITGDATLNDVVSADNASSGYFFNESKNVVVTNSESTGNGAHGVYVLESTAELNNMTVSKSYWCGLSATGTNAVVAVNGGQYINNGTRPDAFEGDDSLCAGIGVYAGATTVITEVTCNENHGCGIAVTGSEDGTAISKADIYGCTLNNNGDHGIGARPYGEVNVQASESNQKNIIKNNKNHGIMLNDHCTSDCISGCTITGNGKAGMSVAVNSVAKVIEDNVISENTEDGIHLSDGSEAVIRRCEITNNTLAGVGVYSSSKVDIYKKCIIRGNKTYGICVDSSTATSIDNNTISEN